MILDPFHLDIQRIVLGQGLQKIAVKSGIVHLILAEQKGQSPSHAPTRGAWAPRVGVCVPQPAGTLCWPPQVSSGAEWTDRPTRRAGPATLLQSPLGS